MIDTPKISRIYTERKPNSGHGNRTPWVLIMWSQTSPFRWNCLVWDLNIKAPINDMFTDSQDAVTFLKDLVNQKSYEGKGLKVNLNSFIKNNLAGPGGETLTWDQIKALYEKK